MAGQEADLDKVLIVLWRLSPSALLSTCGMTVAQVAQATLGCLWAWGKWDQQWHPAEQWDSKTDKLAGFLISWERGDTCTTRKMAITYITAGTDLWLRGFGSSIPPPSFSSFIPWLSPYRYADAAVCGPMLWAGPLTQGNIKIHFSH